MSTLRVDRGMLAPTPSSLRAVTSRSRAAKDAAVRVGIWLAFLLAMVPLVWILASTLVRGGLMLLDVDWWTKSQSGITARHAGGGAAHAIQGTLIQALVTTMMSVPVGVLTAIYLVEFGQGRMPRVVSFMVDILTGIPSIVAGLFIYALWVTALGLERAPFAVTLALTMLMIPTVVRSTEEMLRLVPNELREAAHALGVPKWRTVLKVVLPTAFSGIVTGILLGLARVMGETAPLIILGPYTKVITTDLFDGFMATLPTMINQDRTEALQPAIDRVWGAALTLILLILALNVMGRLISELRARRP